jgi:environmental stress-induced protein Ves
MSSWPCQDHAVCQTAPVAWKNGRGVTRELVSAPAGRASGLFDWRISVAAVDA